MYLMLTGIHPEWDYFEQYFLCDERETAEKIAQIWEKNGWKPRLYAKTWNSVTPLSLKQIRKAA